MEHLTLPRPRVARRPAALTVGTTVELTTPAAVAVAGPGFALVAAAFIGRALLVTGPVDEPADLTAEAGKLN